MADSEPPPSNGKTKFSMSLSSRASTNSHQNSTSLPSSSKNHSTVSKSDSKPVFIIPTQRNASKSQKSPKPRAFRDDSPPSSSDEKTKVIESFDSFSKKEAPKRVIQGLKDSFFDGYTSNHASGENTGEGRERKRRKVGNEKEVEDEGDEEKSIGYGLNVFKRSSPPNGTNEGAEENSDKEKPEVNNTSNHQVEGEDKDSTLDEEAIQALKTGQNPSLNRIIQSEPSNTNTESEAFTLAFSHAAPTPRETDYANVPVDGFGAAILRGFLKPGQTLDIDSPTYSSSSDSKQKPTGSKPNNSDQNNNALKKGNTLKLPEKRPALLGLGAKSSGLGVELDAWGKGADGRSKSKHKLKSKAGDEGFTGYNPVMLKNRKTGEVLTEKELKEKVEVQAEIEKDKDRDFDKRRRGREGYEDGRGRDHDIESKSEGESESEKDGRRRERRRDRERDRDRENERSKNKHSSYTDEREREREKEKEKEKERNKNSHRKKDRPRSHDRDRNRDHFRDYTHSKSRESRRERKRDR